VHAYLDVALGRAPPTARCWMLAQQHCSHVRRYRETKCHGRKYWRRLSRRSITSKMLSRDCMIVRLFERVASKRGTIAAPLDAKAAVRAPDEHGAQFGTFVANGSDGAEFGRCPCRASRQHRKRLRSTR
jgi:hypothetical protein